MLKSLLSLRQTCGLLGVVALSVCGVAHAQTVSFTAVGSVSGAAGGTLNIGRTFTVSSATGVTLGSLGIFDYQGNGLVASHNVALYSLTGPLNAPTSTTLLATVTVPAGISATLLGVDSGSGSGFRFGALTTPIFLPSGAEAAVIGYGLSNTGDPYGDGGGLPSNSIANGGFDPYQFTGTTSGYPNAGDTNNHSSASFLYQVGNTAAPEPGALALLTGVALPLAASMRRRKSA